MGFDTLQYFVIESVRYFSHATLKLRLLLSVIGQDCIVFIDDFTVSKTPSSNGRKYYISSPSVQGLFHFKLHMSSTRPAALDINES